MLHLATVDRHLPVLDAGDTLVQGPAQRPEAIRLSERVLLVGQQEKLPCCNKRPAAGHVWSETEERRGLLKKDEEGRGSRLSAQQVQRLE